MKIIKQWIQEDSDYIRKKVIEHNQKSLSDEEKTPSENISFIVKNEKECRLINLDTFSFQAPDFYKKHGYKVIGVSEDHPKGHNHYYLEKRL